MAKKIICGMTADEIFRLIEPWGYTIAHAASISNSVYKKGITEISQLTRISGILKEELGRIASIGIFRPVYSQVSVDGTVKYRFRTETGKEFETVFIPENKRITVCVSTQAGCKMGCKFCITGRIGFRGNLTAGEIVNQILSIPIPGKVTHVVFMGMGEPMDNLENVLKACEIITAEWGFAISPRNVTVSSVGITPGIESYLKSTECNLTLSLHSPFAVERLDVAPIEKLYPVNTILEILKNFPLRKKRRLSISYIMIKDVNDTDGHLSALKGLLQGSKLRVNLLPFHPAGNDTISSSSDEKMQYFKHDLVISGISASVRKSRGLDISAACGLLAGGSG
jgi:23S rRNA (adenine2503-C2)-methyltransferase